MGGLILFIAIAVPYLVLSPRDTAEPRGLRRRARVRRARLRRRLHQGHQAALARPLRALEAARPDRPGAGPLVGGDRAGRPRPARSRSRIFDAQHLHRPGALRAAGLPRHRRRVERGQPDRRPRRAGGRARCAIVLLAYTAITITSGQEGLALLSACLVGASVGFLWFNSFPASIFMGDTGSLGLGGGDRRARGDDPDRAPADHPRRDLRDRGALGRDPGLRFKMFRRRVLLMAPVHHHFEMMAWSETKIMLRFWIVAAVCAGIGYTLYQHSIG